MKKGLILLIVVGFLLITTGIVGSIMNNNDINVGVESTVTNNGRVRNNQYGRQYNNESINQRGTMMRGSNYNRSNQCPYVN